jgi:outer membrane protein
MKTKTVILFMMAVSPIFLKAQPSVDTTKAWSLSDCIDYALEQNIQVRGSELTSRSDKIYVDQAKWQRFPTVSASVSQNFNWSKSGSSQYSGNNSTNYSVNTGVSVYNGFKLSNKIKQAELNLESSKYNSATIKESVSLNVLNAYLQVLYAEELVKNSEKQVESTTEQLQLAEERLRVSIISQSDYLQVKSELASEKLTLANAKSNLGIAKVSLMQLMELPVRDNFEIMKPEMEGELNQKRSPDATEVYTMALGLKPQIKGAELSKKSAEFGEKIAQAGFYPSLSLNAGVGTGYSSILKTDDYWGQIDNKINPSVGLSLSIPVFEQYQAKTSVQLAKINIQDAELNEADVKNQLRKNIEQACFDVSSAQTRFEASKEKYSATLESYNLAEAKFKNGLINSVDYIIEKTNLIVAESDLLQSKYNLIFNYRILDFYVGKPLSL